MLRYAQVYCSKAGASAMRALVLRPKAHPRLHRLTASIAAQRIVRHLERCGSSNLPDVPIKNTSAMNASLNVGNTAAPTAHMVRLPHNLFNDSMIC